MENTELKERICSLNNEELIKLLKQRDAYQKEAVEIAVNEAINREIIQSVDDLNNEHFQQKNTYSKSIFPNLHNEIQFKKVFSSLTRLLYLIAILPIVFGALKLIESQIFYGLILLVSGALWISVSILLEKKQNTKTPLLLGVIFIINVAFIFFNEPQISYFKLSDWLIFTLAILLVSYVLIYLTVLLNRKNNLR